MSAPPPDFSACWLAALSQDRGAWSLLSASILLGYGYALSNRKFLWNLLLVNAIAGTCGIIIQTCYKAVHFDPDQISDSNRECNNLLPDAHTEILLGVNEIFWYLNETTTVLYSFFKIETVTTVTIPRKYGIVLRVIMGLFCIAYLPLRIYIGYLRVSRNSYWDDAVGSAHGYAFITWGIAEAVIIGMLIQASIYAKNGFKSFGSVINTICSSSVLRLLVISVNQVSIAFVTQLPKPTDENGYRTWASTNFENVLWLIRGVYPMIMLFDILSTQSLLVERSSGSSNKSRTGGSIAKTNNAYDYPAANVASIPVPVDIPNENPPSQLQVEVAKRNLQQGSGAEYSMPVNSWQN